MVAITVSDTFRSRTHDDDNDDPPHHSRFRLEESEHYDPDELDDDGVYGNSGRGRKGRVDQAKAARSNKASSSSAKKSKAQLAQPTRYVIDDPEDELPDVEDEPTVNAAAVITPAGGLTGSAAAAAAASTMQTLLAIGHSDDTHSYPTSSMQVNDDR